MTGVVDTNVVAYYLLDTEPLFVELAAQRDLKLATFDTELLKKFPEIAQRPRSFASN